jgi:hypothetical protein
MEARSDLADRLVLPIRPGAIGQQSDGDSRVQIDPEGAAAKTQMPDGMPRKMLTGR